MYSLRLIALSQSKTYYALCIFREAKRGTRLKCVFCRRSNATGRVHYLAPSKIKNELSVGCAEPKCKKSYHLSCGNTHKALFQFFDQFKSYCKEHRLSIFVFFAFLTIYHVLYRCRPVQNMQKKSGKGESVCVVCSSTIPRKTSFSTFIAPCCSAFLHKDCIQVTSDSSEEAFMSATIREWRLEVAAEVVPTVATMSAGWQRCEGWGSTYLSPPMRQPSRK